MKKTKMKKGKKGKKKGLTGAQEAVVALMLVDCALIAGRGAATKRVSLEAAKFWAKGYKKTFSEAVFNGADYEADREGVLLMGLLLGRRAKELAGNSMEISRAMAKQASKEISNEHDCGAGGGIYCPPGNFDF